MKWLDTPTKILIFAATIATLTWTAIQITDWYNRPSDELTALVTSSAFVLPPTVEPVFSSLIETNIKGGKETQHLALNLSELSQYVSQWTIAIKNSGQTTLNEVTLTLPFECLVSVNYPDKNPESYTTSGTVKIGDLAAQESVDVTCWTYQPDRTDNADRISIVHQHGIGKVSKMVLVKDTRYLSFAQHPFVVVFMICLATLFLHGKFSKWQIFKNLDKPSVKEQSSSEEK